MPHPTAVRALAGDDLTAALRAAFEREAGLLRDNALLDIQAGRFKIAQERLDRALALTPRDPIAHLFYGDLYHLEARRRTLAQQTAFLRKAFEAYQRAAELDRAFADPFRQLGLLYYEQKDEAHAREAFERYLALKADATDASRINGYLVELGGLVP